MAKARRLEIDWSAIRAELDGIRAAIVPFRIASQQDIELCKLSDMTHGMIASNLVKDWRRSECIVVLDQDKRERLIDIAFILGFSDDDRFTNHKNQGEDRPKWQRLDELISDRIVTAEFLNLWALLHFYFGAYLELYNGNEEIYKREFHQCMMSVGDATKVQRHWYAHWMHEAVKKNLREVGDARSDLITLIEGIAAGKLKPWGPYGVDWYECMLERQKDPGSRRGEYSGDLKTSYTKLSVAAINRMVHDPLLTQRVLPPLYADRFDRA